MLTEVFHLPSFPVNQYLSTILSMQENIGVILAILFIFQIFSLYLFSRLLIRSLSHLIIKITRSQTATVHLLATFFLPGTFVHEMAHALTAALMLVTVHDIHLFPKVEEHGIKLGSVEIDRTDPFRRALIGVAPIIWGISMLLLFTWLIESFVPREWGSWWMYLIVGYLIFVTSNTMFSSRKDMEGMLLINVLIIATVGGLLLLKVYAPFIWFANLLNTNSSFMLGLNIYLLVPIIVDIFIYSIFKLLRFNR